MGQVPQYGIIGGGRVATHFCHYFRLEEIPFIQWTRSSPESIALLETCAIILLLVADNAIESVIEETPFLKTKRLVHFSGSHISPRAWGTHPLMTFSSELYDLEFYRKIPFIIEECVSFKEIFPALKNPSFPIQNTQKGLYHALCVLSGNFSTLLWENFFRTLETKFNIPRSVAYPYLDRCTLNVKSLGQEALSGPLVRKDLGTLQKNLMALKDDPFEGVYRAFVKAYLSGESYEDSPRFL